MVYPMPSFIESSMKTQNSIMILMEICLILERIEFLFTFFPPFSLIPCDLTEKFSMSSGLPARKTVCFVLSGKAGFFQSQNINNAVLSGICTQPTLHVTVMATLPLIIPLLFCIKRQASSGMLTLLPRISALWSLPLHSYFRDDNFPSISAWSTLDIAFIFWILSSSQLPRLLCRSIA